MWLWQKIWGQCPHPLIPGCPPLVEDMLCDARTRLTKTVVIGPGRAVLFYERCSMGEGLTTDEARDATFLLTGAGMCFEKLAYLAADPMTIQEGRRAIAQAISDQWVKVRGPRTSPCQSAGPTTLLVWSPKKFPLKDASGDGGSDHQPSPCWPSRSWERNRCQRDQRPPSSWFPSPSLDHGFESDQSSLSMASLMSSRSDRSDRSQCPRRGRWHQEDGTCKRCSNLPELEVGFNNILTCRVQGLHPPTLYAMRSLQGYPRELVWIYGTDITLDNVWTILDEHYNNVKVLDVLNQELFQLQMADKVSVRLGCSPFKASSGFSCFLPWLFSPRSCGRVEERPLLWQTSLVIKSNGSLPEGRVHGWEHTQTT